jgi:hypothetical protein
MTAGRFPVVIPVQPWLVDHHFHGRVIFPAVTALCLLARSTEEHYPGHNVRIMADCRLSRLLEIAPGQREIPGQIELAESADGTIRASLGTCKKLQKMSRTVIHCEVSFPGTTAFVEEDGDLPHPTSNQATVEIPTARIYQQMVPFGPAFHSLSGTLVLQAHRAWGTLQAPDPPGAGADQGPLGNPFPFDGAMHAACVHGQHLVDFVPFPVGFATRTIVRPTRSGERYSCMVQLDERRADELVYRLEIRDWQGLVREIINGLRMRDITGGTIPAFSKKEPFAK